MAQDESVIQKAWASMMSASGRRAKFKDKLSDGTPMSRDKTAATLRTLVRAGLWNPHLDSQQAQDNWRSAIAQILHEKMALYNDPGREFVNDAIIRQCLAAGVDPNARDKERHFDTLWGQALRRNLVSAGAELLGTGQCDLELADGTGTPALYAAWCVDTEKGRKRGSIWFEMLMDEGAQINTLARLEKGANPKRAEELVPTNPLIEAASHGCEAGIAFFLSHGADPNAADPKGRRAIHHLARRNLVGGQDLVDFKQSQARSMDLLIQAGADLDACDHHGQTALVVAMRAGLSDNALLLLGKGARADIRVVSEDGFNGGYCLHAPAIASIPLEKLEPVLHEIETRWPDCWEWEDEAGQTPCQLYQRMHKEGANIQPDFMARLQSVSLERGTPQSRASISRRRL